MTEIKKLQSGPTYLHSRKFSQSVFPRFSALVRPLRNLTEFNCPAIRAGAEKCQTIDPPRLSLPVLAIANNRQFSL